MGDRYGSQVARFVAVICAIFISFTYVAGQMRGVGVVFSRFLEVDITLGVIIGMGLVFFYAVLGGMKGITYTQVAQYCVLIFAYTVPAVFLGLMATGNPIPQFALGADLGVLDLGSLGLDGLRLHRLGIFVSVGRIIDARLRLGHRHRGDQGDRGRTQAENEASLHRTLQRGGHIGRNHG